MNKRLLFCLAFLFLGLFFQFVGATAIIPSPIPGIPDLKSLLNVLFLGFVSIAGLVCAMIIVVSGFKLMVSVGNPEAMTKAKNSIWYASIGLVVLLSSVALYNFVIKVLNP